MSAECKGHFPLGPIHERATNVQKKCDLRERKVTKQKSSSILAVKILSVKTQLMLRFKTDNTFSLSSREEKESVNQLDSVRCVITDLYIFDSRTAEGMLTFN